MKKQKTKMPRKETIARLMLNLPVSCVQDGLDNISKAHGAVYCANLCDCIFKEYHKMVAV